ncbi:cell division cycle 25 homolog d isoform X1 [Scleropages formosus]|uniref:M-phase inducer phosphatase n=1 Tax=Scleropages formosus TaxID=113540 RepID=A0A8C9SA26_SCLFO|nr:M-phase inducer phosphatase 1-like isoform X1 [Scleropages formosus]XP_018606207.2 M-phase inducer phosphatase 1-like isoform X1 [Scleropages formosus]
MEERSGGHHSTSTTSSSSSLLSPSSFVAGSWMEDSRSSSEDETSQSCSMWSWSPSPLSELSLDLGNLHCSDSGTPRRSPSPLVNRRVSIETRTPAAKRKGERFASPKCCLSKMKRLRVRLANRFPSSVPIKEPDPSGERRSWTPQARSDDCPGYKDQTQPGPLLPLWQVRSRQRLSPSQLSDTVVEDRSLIGDFSKPHLFPVARGDHCDLQGVSVQTVASLLQGKYCNAVESFLIIDCRYPYEYQGGHIMGAVNLHSEAQLQEALFWNPRSVLKQLPREAAPLCSAATAPLPDTHRSPGQGSSTKLTTPDSPPRVQSSPQSSSPHKLIVFHCEFSSQRGPQLCRYLRKLDRSLNVYPQLFYPELYILEGGYREFYSHFPDLCDPHGYVPMIHRDFMEQLRTFRKKRRPKVRRFRPETVSELHS